MLKKIGITVVAAMVLFMLIQLVPYGRGQSNPPVTAEVKWNSAQTRELAVRACYDCHSNATESPWYASVAPVSWLIQKDIQDGRSKLNFSEWDRPQQEIDKAEREVQSGSMPQWYYVLLHPAANLSPTEKQTLIDGLKAIAGSR